MLCHRQGWIVSSRYALYHKNMKLASRKIYCFPCRILMAVIEFARSTVYPLYMKVRETRRGLDRTSSPRIGFKGCKKDV